RAFGEFGATVILAYHPYSLPVFTFVQFSSTGLPTALPPTGMAILAAAVVLVVVMWRPERLLKAALRLARTGASRHGRDRARAAKRPDGRDTGRADSRPDGRGSATAPTRPEDRGTARAALWPDGRDGAWTAPAATRPAELRFDLRTTVGTFELALEHAGASRHLALLGPSGAGKSLTLRCLAGLRPGDVGEVMLGERELGSLPPERRRVGWVPQDAALIPHLDVWRQVTFGVRADPAAAAHWLERLRIAELRERLPHELSGGQRQRVALARALASRPDLLLLDEPFSALDRPVREQLRRELRHLQREIGIATVLVTHDPEEAAMLADEVIVIADGRRLQSGPRDAVFTRPASEAVARLLGIDNLREGRIESAGQLVSSGTRLAVEHDAAAPGSAVRWCIRAERVLLTEPGAPEPGHMAGHPALGHVAAHPALGHVAGHPALGHVAGHPALGHVAGEGAALSPNGAASSHRALVEDVLELGGLRELVVTLDGGLRLTARAPAAPWQRPGAVCTAILRACDITLWADGAEQIADGPRPGKEAATRATGPQRARGAPASVVWPYT
ncbi:MAG TPA: ATP-binding cassette domain-containing protein, partial [Solirubrobacteraceae bacterium]|nr:ATP-binding cassette domain-containing protein [Solirubrobacteraceae bacterium]